MSLDGHDRIINGLHSANKQASKAVKAEVFRVYSTRTWSDQAGKHPSQEDPGIDQDQTHSQKEESQGGITRSGMSSHLAHRAVAALDAEAPAIAGIDLLR